VPVTGLPARCSGTGFTSCRLGYRQRVVPCTVATVLCSPPAPTDGRCMECVCRSTGFPGAPYGVESPISLGDSLSALNARRWAKSTHAAFGISLQSPSISSSEPRAPFCHRFRYTTMPSARVATKPIQLSDDRIRLSSRNRRRAGCRITRCARTGH